jgi:hypothetical protein
VTVRRSDKTATPEDARGLEVEAQATPPDDSSAEAAFAAHMMGQERRRGARAGADVPDSANSAYSRTEWSGSADRRARRGQLTTKKI